MKSTQILLLTTFTLMAAACAGASPTENAPGVTVEAPRSPLTTLAARELRRYVYLRTGTLLPPAGQPAADGPAIVLGVDPKLGAQEYRLKTETQGARRILRITGGTEQAVLYGAYAFAEKLGVRFYLDGDVIPDQKIKWELPDLDETRKPLFEMRGINPWATHVYGFEMWEAEGFKSVISQLVKMRMNFIGMHTYTECGWGSEPTAWIGQSQDVAANGDPKFSYSSFYFNTERNIGGQAAERTDQYGYGGGLLFETDEWGVSVMKGNMPVGKTPEGKNEVFIRTGNLLRAAFEHAHLLGVKTAVGTEIPLTHPTQMLPYELRAHLKEQGKSVQDPAVHKDLYKGTFLRAMKAYPIDYFWLWTPEGWRVPQPDSVINATRDDLLLAVQAGKEAKVPFKLATAGWTLGPSSDRTMFDKLLPKDMPFAALNLELGSVPVDADFKKLGKDRSGWAIPWMESDFGLNCPQLWVGRMLRDSYDAHKYGCSGLMGLHWRTQEVSPMVGALEQAQWQVPTLDPVSAAASVAEEAGIRPLGGLKANFPAPQKNTKVEPVYQTNRYGMTGYEFKVPNGQYKVTLQFNEGYFGAPKNRVFGVTLQGRTVIEELDIFAKAGKDCALDYTFDATVKDGKLAIGFLSDISQTLMADERAKLKVHYASLPCIAGIVLDGPKKLKLNCGGPAWHDYMADSDAANTPRYLPTEDFYRDWAAHQFGPEAAEKIAQWFARRDGQMPLPAPGCPDDIAANGSPWSEVKKGYAFVDELADLRPQIVGQGNLARFDHWVKSFESLRAIAKVGGSFWEAHQAMIEVQKIKDPAEQKKRARELALPARIRLNQDWGDMVTRALESADSWGGLGAVIGFESNNRRGRLDEDQSALEKALGEPLPAAAQVWHDYRGQSRLIVLTPQSQRTPTEAITLKVIVLDNQAPQSAVLRWRALGGGEWHDIPLAHVARAVHSVTLPVAPTAGDGTVEYYIEAKTAAGKTLRWPDAAPEINQTVVVIPAASKP